MTGPIEPAEVMQKAVNILDAMRPVDLIVCDTCLTVRVKLKEEPSVGVTADSPEEKLKGNTRPLFPCRICQRPQTFHEVVIGFMNIPHVREIRSPRPKDIQP